MVETKRLDSILVLPALVAFLLGVTPLAGGASASSGGAEARQAKVSADSCQAEVSADARQAEHPLETDDLFAGKGSPAVHARPPAPSPDPDPAEDSQKEGTVEDKPSAGKSEGGKSGSEAEGKEPDPEPGEFSGGDDPYRDEADKPQPEAGREPDSSSDEPDSAGFPDKDDAAKKPKPPKATGSTGGEEEEKAGKSGSSGKKNGTTKKKKVAAPKKKSGPFYYEYVVEKGDTIYMIARKFSTTEERIKRWNKSAFDRKGRLKNGASLKIFATLPVRVKSKAIYTVVKGDNLNKVARRTGTSVKEIKRLNGLVKDRLTRGQQLVYLVKSAGEPSESVGYPYSGKLLNGEKLPRGPGYTYGSRPNVYGTNETITTIIDVITTFRKKHPKAPIIVIGNLSRPNGGRFDPHKSHQSGRDVDVGYIHKKRFQPITRMITTDAGNLEPGLTWSLIKSFLDTKTVDVMYIDYEIQKVLYDWLKGKGVKKRLLDKLFQYPKGRGGAGVIRHEDGHYHHIHIRFKCPRGDEKCKE